MSRQSRRPQLRPHLNKNKNTRSRQSDKAFNRRVFQRTLFKNKILKLLLCLFGSLLALRCFLPAQLDEPSAHAYTIVKPSLASQARTSLKNSDGSSDGSNSATLAFPGAEGFGALAKGGRGGRILEVTNLNDAGPGSLRAALEADGPRIVVFRIAGTIILKDKIRISHPYLTVAGQTAPAGGITLRGTDNSLISIRRDAHDIIIRYLKLRNGSGVADGNGHDNLTINSGYNIIVDHVSMSWSTDENLSIYQKPNTPRIFNVTIQNSIMAEGLAGHSNGMIVSGTTHQNPAGQWLTEWSDIKNITIHHNLFVNNTHRNPRVTSGGTAVINNVVYNWKYKIGEITRGSVIDVVGNYLKPGPMSIRDRLFIYNDPSLNHLDEPRLSPSIYTHSNLLAINLLAIGRRALDNWSLWSRSETFAPLPNHYRRFQPLPAAPLPITQQSAEAAYESVLANSGANARLVCDGRWIQQIDAVDNRLFTEVKTSTGPSDPYPSPTAAGGYPDISAGQSCADQDHDGMPDRWETLHGLNLQGPEDASQSITSGGYTQLEAYLNGGIPQS